MLAMIGVAATVISGIVGITQIMDFFSDDDLRQADVDDKIHENMMTRIKNMDSVLDGCEREDEISTLINFPETKNKLQNAAKLVSIHNDFDSAERILDEIATSVEKCPANIKILTVGTNATINPIITESEDEN